MSGLVVLLIILAVIVILGLTVMGAYNRLVRLRQFANQAFADIDVQLKQRHDLIPNLVETVKGYATHERGTLEAVMAARNSAVAANGRRGQGGRREHADRRLGSSVRRRRSLS